MVWTITTKYCTCVSQNSEHFQIVKIHMYNVHRIKLWVASHENSSINSQLLRFYHSFPRHFFILAICQPRKTIVTYTVLSVIILYCIVYILYTFRLTVSVDCNELVPVSILVVGVVGMVSKVPVVGVVSIVGVVTSPFDLRYLLLSTLNKLK